MVLKRDLVVIGASAGGVEALIQLVQGLPRGWPATVLVVLHLGADQKSYLPRILSRAGPLPATEAGHGDALRKGHIYVAPPDWHLFLDDRHISLEHFAKENGHRPAIDVLFRSAAHAYGPRVVGVLLSGSNDDGTVGLLTIKQAGGETVVQEPRDASFPQMPQSAVDNAHPDHVIPIREIAPLLTQLMASPPQGGYMKKQKRSPSSAPAPTGLTCPDCGGALWQEDVKEIPYFYCHVGHKFTENSLAQQQAALVESALWTAHRVLKERAAFAFKMAERARDKDIGVLKQNYERRAQDAQEQADVIRRLLIQPDASPLKGRVRPARKREINRLKRTIRANGA